MQHDDTPSLVLTPGQRLSMLCAAGDRFSTVRGGARLYLGRKVRREVKNTGAALVVMERGAYALVNNTDEFTHIRWTRMGTAYGDLVGGAK